MELMMTLGLPSTLTPAHALANAAPARKRAVGGARPVQDRAVAFSEIVVREIDAHVISDPAARISGYATSGFKTSGFGTSGFEIGSSVNGTIAGNDIPAVAAPLAWDVRGVPPRGRPV